MELLHQWISIRTHRKHPQSRFLFLTSWMAYPSGLIRSWMRTLECFPRTHNKLSVKRVALSRGASIATAAFILWRPLRQCSLLAFSKMTCEQSLLFYASQLLIDSARWGAWCGHSKQLGKSSYPQQGLLLLGDAMSSTITETANARDTVDGSFLRQLFSMRGRTGEGPYLYFWQGNFQYSVICRHEVVKIEVCIYL